jgi:maleylacetoacetate isomerase
MPRLTLYNWWRSSCSHRVRIALAMKGLDYEYVSIRLPNSEQSGEAYRGRSPTGYVPCLVVDGVPYVESVAIIELLDEMVPDPPLYPKDRHARARVRSLVEIVNSGMQPLQNSSVQAEVARVTGDPDAAPRWASHFVLRGFDSLERAMEANAREATSSSSANANASRPYAFGHAPTAADVFLVPQVVAARRFGADVAPYARVRAAFEAAMQLEAFQTSMPENQVDADAVNRAR